MSWIDEILNKVYIWKEELTLPDKRYLHKWLKSAKYDLRDELKKEKR